MDPNVKRKIRLVVALSAAVLLAVGLIYTSFSASSEARQPSDLLNAPSGGSYELTGVVVPGSIHHRGSQLDFRMEDREGSTQSIPIRYSGEIPDPFQAGREERDLHGSAGQPDHQVPVQVHDPGPAGSAARDHHQQLRRA